MPLQNRVSPEGVIVAVPARGTMLGNRGGCFHRADKTLLPRHWASKQWICCLLAFKGRKRALMQPGRYTELFFLDEATAFAAGHRPCFECRREDAVLFAALWNVACEKSGRATAADMDNRLHDGRLGIQGRKRTFDAAAGGLPDGTMIRLVEGPALIRNGLALRWSYSGYTAAAPLAVATEVTVLTPRSTVAVLAAGYRPTVHPSGTALLQR